MAVALGDLPVENELGWLIQGQPTVLIAKNGVIDGMVLLFVNERPDFVNLDMGWPQIHQFGVQQGFAVKPGTAQHIQNRRLADPGKAGASANPHSLAEQMHNLRCLISVDAGFSKGLRFRECFPALEATIPLDGSIFVLEVAETLGFALTTMTGGHNELAFLAAWAYRDSESYRILFDGFGHWMRPAGASTSAGLLFLPLNN
jgi:hypothetical protein